MNQIQIYEQTHRQITNNRIQSYKMRQNYKGSFLKQNLPIEFVQIEQKQSEIEVEQADMNIFVVLNHGKGFFCSFDENSED